jgi:hypothetical protein
MKLFKLAVAFVIVGALGYAVHSAPRANPFVTKTSHNDGDVIRPFVVSCSSTAWTTLLPISPTRRVAKMATLASASAVCLSTATPSGSCGVTVGGYRLAATLEYDHYSEALVTCRAADASAAVPVFGLDYTDSGDNTSFP